MTHVCDMFFEFLMTPCFLPELVACVVFGFRRPVSVVLVPTAPFRLRLTSFFLWCAVRSCRSSSRPSRARLSPLVSPIHIRANEPSHRPESDDEWSCPTDVEPSDTIDNVKQKIQVRNRRSSRRGGDASGRKYCEGGASLEAEDGGQRWCVEAGGWHAEGRADPPWATMRGRAHSLSRRVGSVRDDSGLPSVIEVEAR